jgi:DNA replication and repair protein RecF
VSGRGPGTAGSWPFLCPFEGAIFGRFRGPPGRFIGRIAQVRVRGFRNLADADVVLPAAGCVIVGPNGHGKTSLLEAALYCEVFRSFRLAADQELVKFGADGFFVAAETETAGGHAAGTSGSAAAPSAGPPVRRSVACGFDARTKAKKITVDGATTAKAQDAIGLVRGVVLSPGDVSLVAGGPRERRRYLDVLLSLTVPGYVEALTRYRRALAHRLRAGTADMATWERLLAERGAAVVRARQQWADAWRGRYAELCAALGERGRPELVFQPSVEGSGGADGGDALARAYERHRARDLAQGRTGAGPHRDRLTPLLDGRDLRVYGSAGQQRTAAIALRIVEAESLGRAAADPVTVGLDDAFAELDDDRSARLAGLIEAAAAGGGQVLAAVPRDRDVPASLRSLAVIRIHEGRVA